MTSPQGGRSNATSEPMQHESTRLEGYHPRWEATRIIKPCNYHPSGFRWNCNRPSPIGNPFHLSDTASDDSTQSARNRNVTNAAFSTAMFSVISCETTSFAAIAAFHNLPADSIQFPYKDMKWDHYADNFRRTLRRLLLYIRAIDQQPPESISIHLSLMGDNDDPTTNHLLPIVAWLNHGTQPRNPAETTPLRFSRP